MVREVENQTDAVRLAMYEAMQSPLYGVEDLNELQCPITGIRMDDSFPRKAGDEHPIWQRRLPRGWAWRTTTRHGIVADMGYYPTVKHPYQMKVEPEVASAAYRLWLRAQGQTRWSHCPWCQGPIVYGLHRVVVLDNNGHDFAAHSDCWGDWAREQLDEQRIEAYQDRGDPDYDLEREQARYEADLDRMGGSL